MKVMKRTLCLVLALVMLVGMCVISVSAAEATKVYLNIDYNNDGNYEARELYVENANYTDVTLPTPAKEYHLWDGWYQDKKDVGNESKLILSLSMNKKYELYGRFIPTCTVNYNIDGSRVKQDSAMLAEELASYSLYTPAEKPGYTFSGWWEFQKDIGVESKKETAPLSFKTKYELYGSYVANTYTVSFYDTDGTTLLSSKDVEYNTTYNLPTADEIKKDGFVLVGWKYGSKTWEPGAECKYTATSNFKMTAVWDVATIPSVPTTPLNPTPAIPRYLKNAVVVSCGSDHHDTLTLDIEKLSADAQITMNEAKDTATIRLSDEDYSTILAAYNDATDAKHTFVNKVGTAIVLKYKAPCFPFFKGGWYVDTKAEMEVTCECDKWCGHHCGGWWHNHTVTYTDGVKNATVFKDITYTVKHGAKTPVPADPTRAGYKFAGWTPAVSAKTTKCVTYTATWTAVKAPALTTKHVAYLKGYGGGIVKPEGEITRAEAITMLYRLMDAASVKEYYTSYNAFTDVAKDAWYNDAVSTLANAGVLRYKTGLLNPNEKITRAEFFYMLTKFSNATYTGKATFVDVPVSYWAYEELALAQYLGWIKGYGGGILYPDDTITRAEVAASLNRVLGRTDCKTKDTKNYSDNPVNAWYYQDIVEASIAH